MAETGGIGGGVGTGAGTAARGADGALALDERRSISICVTWGRSKGSIEFTTCGSSPALDHGVPDCIPLGFRHVQSD